MINADNVSLEINKYQILDNVSISAKKRSSRSCRGNGNGVPVVDEENLIDIFFDIRYYNNKDGQLECLSKR